MIKLTAREMAVKFYGSEQISFPAVCRLCQHESRTITNVFSHLSKRHQIYVKRKESRN